MQLPTTSLLWLLEVIQDLLLVLYPTWNHGRLRLLQAQSIEISQVMLFLVTRKYSRYIVYISNFLCYFNSLVSLINCLKLSLLGREPFRE